MCKTNNCLNKGLNALKSLCRDCYYTIKYNLQEKFNSDLYNCENPLKELKKLTQEDENGCWNWISCVGKNGYGVYSIQGKRQYTHRLAYEFSGQKLDSDLCLDHLCRNRKCCNPEHLEQVTQAVNTNRGDGVNYQYKPKDYCSKGHKYSEVGFYKWNNRPGKVCKICEYERTKTKRARKKLKNV